MKESRNLLALAQGIRVTPWPIEESDDEVNEADLQATLEASKKADNVVPFSSSGTVSLPVSFSPSLVSSLPSAVVCSNMPSSSVCSIKSSLCVDFADVRARVLSTQSILTSLKSIVVRMEKVLLDDKKLLQSFEAGDVGSFLLLLDDLLQVCCCIPRRVCSIKSSLCVDFADVRARVLSTQSILTSLKSTVVRMEKVLLDDKKLLQSFEAGDVGSFLLLLDDLLQGFYFS
nr:hypothetical protein Iba_chr02eCG12040 [Ipomoea batatas]